MEEPGEQSGKEFDQEDEAEEALRIFLGAVLAGKEPSAGLSRCIERQYHLLGS